MFYIKLGEVKRFIWNETLYSASNNAIEIFSALYVVKQKLSGKIKHE
jgi:hypothetical protein